LTRIKGRNKRNARPGNKNTAKGPRLGRKDKRPTSKVAAPALPSPQSGAAALTSGGRAHREKPASSGRDFEPGQNSHDCTVFRRGPDQIPRGNGTLMLRIIHNDKRQKIYDQVCAMIDGSPEGAFRFLTEFIDRTEGRPGRKGNAMTPHFSRFTLTTRDGQEIDVIPPRIEERAKPAAATPVTGEDAMILGFEGTDKLLKA